MHNKYLSLAWIRSLKTVFKRFNWLFCYYTVGHRTHRRKCQCRVTSERNQSNCQPFETGILLYFFSKIFERSITCYDVFSVMSWSYCPSRITYSRLISHQFFSIYIYIVHLYFLLFIMYRKVNGKKILIEKRTVQLLNKLHKYAFENAYKTASIIRNF